MTESREEKHDRAMHLADEGLYLRRNSQHEQALIKFAEAFELESQVANQTPGDLQPGYGLLHRSAATLALDANRLSDAMNHVEKGIGDVLWDRRSLSAKPTQLPPSASKANYWASASSTANTTQETPATSCRRRSFYGFERPILYS